MNNSLLIFYATGEPGYSETLRKASGTVTAYKRAFSVKLRFTERDCWVKTLEGEVVARAGDAIVTGLAGEQWPVSRDDVVRKYRPISPTAFGCDGMYLSLPVEVMALSMDCAFVVVMRDGCSRLSGHAGDWLVDYGDGSLGIVAAQLFASMYEIKDVN